MHTMLKYLGFSVLFLATLSSCNLKNGVEQNTNQQSETKKAITIPQFNADTAYQNIATQVAFGPRIPNSKGHTDCGNWLQARLKEICDTVFVQETTVIAGDKTVLPCKNLIGAINPDAKRRILLLSHWDSRPWADQEKPPSYTPIDAADDGASGVGVLLELGKVLKANKFNKDIGVDILFVDVEDYGKSEWGDDSYALGAQYWAKHPHLPNYTAEAGILLDMVGAKGAFFPQEGFSKQYASYVLKQVWQAAGEAGYSSLFSYQEGGFITDDHIPINEIRKIPTIDIINLPQGSHTGFGSHWHTHNDNMNIIDKNTLKAVGQTLLQYLYSLN